MSEPELSAGGKPLRTEYLFTIGHFSMQPQSPTSPSDQTSSPSAYSQATVPTTISHVPGPSVATLLPSQRQAALDIERLDRQISPASPNSPQRAPATSTLLKHVDPKNSLLIRPMPCEEQCAYIRNQTKEAINDEHVSMAAFRYLQSREGRNFTKSEAIRQGKIAAILLLFGGVPALPSALYMLPLVGNATRYLKTKKIAAAYLREISPEMFSEIKSIEYTDRNVKQNLYAVLQKYGIPMSKEFQEDMKQVTSSDTELPQSAIDLMRAYFSVELKGKRE